MMLAKTVMRILQLSNLAQIAQQHKKRPPNLQIYNMKISVHMIC